VGARTAFLPLSLALLVVVLTVVIARADALPWQDPIADGYERLRVRSRDGVANLEDVEIRFRQTPGYTVTIHGNGQAHIVTELHADRLGSFEFQVPRAGIERILGRFEALDFMQADPRLEIVGCSSGTRHRVQLAVDGRVRRFTMPASSDAMAWSSPQHEAFWRQFEALVTCIQDECQVSRWIGSGGRR
jgi:hypothetical protein